MRGECLAAPCLALPVSLPDQTAGESPLFLQILTIMVMRPLPMNYDPANFGQPRAHSVDRRTQTYRQRWCTILATIQHRCAQHVDVSGYYKANSHPHATGSPLVSRMIVSFDIAVAAGGEASVWGLPLTVSVGCRPWLDLHGTSWVGGERTETPTVFCVSRSK
eukprot:scaffold70663_cov76-Cyclotella_meneghiniana.AAC.1